MNHDREIFIAMNNRLREGLLVPCGMHMIPAGEIFDRDTVKSLERFRFQHDEHMMPHNRYVRIIHGGREFTISTDDIRLMSGSSYHGLVHHYRDQMRNNPEMHRAVHHDHMMSMMRDNHFDERREAKLFAPSPPKAKESKPERKLAELNESLFKPTILKLNQNV